MTEPITDEEALAILAIHAMNELYIQGDCCPECCWPCDALQRLADRPDGPGSLNSILTAIPLDGLGFRDEHGCVDREWLAERWTRTSCHQPEPEQEEADA
jgi:hypothetical protein